MQAGPSLTLRFLKTETSHLLAEGGVHQRGVGYPGKGQHGYRKANCYRRKEVLIPRVGVGFLQYPGKKSFLRLARKDEVL